MEKASVEMVEDALPPYSNAIRLLTLCQRKREFNATFDKARRRSWELIWLLLDGTALRIYSPTKEEKRRFEDERLGSPNSSLSIPKGEDTPEQANHSSVPHILSLSSSLPVRVNDDNSSLALSSPSTGNTTPTARLSATSLPRSAQVISPLPDLSTRIPLRQYPVRNSVCMRPDAYFKRDYVLRFILDDGKQFLVQLSSRSETISWLQHISMAAPLALDLDERPMPEPAQYPRTRRRPATTRAVMQTADSSNTSSSSTSPSPPSADRQAAALASSSLVCIPATLRAVEQDDVSDDEAEMDHLPPPPSRPPMLRSLSSVEQARRMGIQI